MKELRDHTDAGVQQPHEVSYIFGCIVMNSHSLIDPFVGERRAQTLPFGIKVFGCQSQRLAPFCRTSGRLIFVTA